MVKEDHPIRKTPGSRANQARRTCARPETFTAVAGVDERAGQFLGLSWSR